MKLRFLTFAIDSAATGRSLFHGDRTHAFSYKLLKVLAQKNYQHENARGII